MAEEIINLPTTPETTKLKGDNLRRKSAGDLNSSNSGGKILPHCLRASTGSCHDNCKYGKKHAFETNPRRPIHKRIATPPPAPDGGNEVEIVVFVDRKKTVIDKFKPLSDSKTVIAESPKIIKREVSSPSMNLEVPLKQVASNTKETSLSAKLPSSLKPKPTTVKSVSSLNSSAVSSGRRKNNANNVKESNVLMKHATSLKPKSVTVNSTSSANAPGDSSGGRDDNNKIGTSRVAVKKVLAPPVASLSSKASPSRVASLNTRNTRSLKIASPLKYQNSIIRLEPKQPSDENVQEKTLFVMKMETENKTLVYVENRSSDENNTLVSDENKIPDKNTLAFVENSSSPDENKISVSVENRSPDGDETLESVENGEDVLKESEYTDSEADDSISEDNENVDMDTTETLEGEYKSRHRKAGLVVSEDKDGNPVKLSVSEGERWLTFSLKIMVHRGSDSGEEKCWGKTKMLKARPGGDTLRREKKLMAMEPILIRKKLF